MGKYDFGYAVYDGSTVQWALSQIEDGSTVLEFGPYNGNLTKHLQEEKNCLVDIVEIDEEAGALAAQYARDAMCGSEKGDIEKYCWCTAYENRKYNYVVFLDVLEHLYDTQKVLSRTKNFLEPDGAILLSIPNIAHNGVILSLLNNAFPYRPLGLLDKTHIRFFAFQSIVQMGKELGFTSEINALQLCVKDSEFAASYDMLSESCAKHLREREYANVYQYLVKYRNPEFSKDGLPPVLDNYDNRVLFTVYIMEQGDEAFSEEKAVRQWIYPGKPIVAEIDISDFTECSRIRIDPMETSCLLQNFHLSAIRADGVRKELEICDSSGTLTAIGQYLFAHKDPQLTYVITEPYQKITCSFEIISYGPEEMESVCKFNSIQKEMETVVHKNETLLTDIKQLHLQLQQMEDRLEALLNAKENQENQFLLQLKQAEDNFGTIMEIKEEQENQLYDIYHSKGWKTICMIRRIKNFVMGRR